MEENICSVSDINAYIKRKLNDDSNLMEVHIRGEISNSKTYANGHSYFTLKDNENLLSCIQFGSKQDYSIGDRVECRGNIKYYPKGGKLSFNSRRGNRLFTGAFCAKSRPGFWTLHKLYYVLY